MRRSASTTLGRCRVLEEDVELAEAIPAALAERAALELVCATVTLRPGSWDGQLLARPGNTIGLLVLDGLLMCGLGPQARFGGELLGAGDLLRPWQPHGEASEHPDAAYARGWRILESTRIAILDETFSAALASYPQLIGRLAGRALRRSTNVVVNLAIVHQTRVDTRVHMLLWHLAGRWGRVAPQGVQLPLRLPHEVLACLVAARRPSVSSAMSALARAELVVAHEDGWLLRGVAPAELLELKSAAG